MIWLGPKTSNSAARKHSVDSANMTKRRLDYEDSQVPCLGVEDFHIQKGEPSKAFVQGDETTFAPLENILDAT